jgi:hypothetical protein
MPYHWATVSGVQTVAGSSATLAKFGKRSPFSRGRPMWWASRGGAGAYSPASKRSRVMKVIGFCRRWQRAKSSRVA